MMNTFQRIALLSIVAAITLLPLTGCGDSGSNPQGNALVKPKAGSTYIFKLTRHTASGNPEVRMDTITVVGTGMTADGVAGLTGFRNSDEPDTFYAEYRSNGDVTMYYPADTNHDGTTDSFDRQTYPYGARRSMELSVDTLGTPGNDYIVRTDSMLYKGETGVSLPGGSFNGSEAMRALHTRGYAVDGTLREHVREIQNYIFAPSVGFFVAMFSAEEEVDDTGATGNRKMGTVVELAGYTIK